MLVRKIKIFEKADAADLQNKVNAWLEQNPMIDICDMQYQASLYHKSICIRYIEEVRE